MDLFANLTTGFDVSLTWTNILFCFVGVLIGTLIGVLPGLGPLPTIAMLLPLTFYLEPVTALIMLTGVYYGAQYGCSTTAILLNIPGESNAVVTCLDGNKLARQGRAGAALAIAAIGSFFAGCIATLLIAIASPFLSGIALEFTAPEYFSLMVLGLVGSAVLAQGSLIRALGMILLGLLLGLVGTDINTGVQRFTFGMSELSDGIGFLALAMGFFGLAEIITSLETKEKQSAIATVGSLWPTRQEMRLAWPAMLRGTGIGSLLGLLPGGGATLSSFAAYTFEKKISRTPERFGNGAIEGLASPESANNAGAQTSFVPLLTLGVPSNALMALMVGAMMIHGITPGPHVMREQPGLFWGIVTSMWLGNLMLLIINLPLLGMWVKILLIPYKYLFPVIIILCALGAYSVNNLDFEIYVMCLFGLIGYLLIKFGCEPAPLLLAFILGPMMEENLRRALLVSDGDFSVFVTRPISLALLFASVGLLLLVLSPTVRKTREEAFQE